MSSFTSQATNPFAMSAHYTQITFECDARAANQVEPYVDDFALSVSAFEIDEAAKRWKVDIVTDQAIDEAEMQRRLKILMGDSATLPQLHFTEVTPDMWQHNLHEFPPISISRYLVHGSHIKPQMIGATYPICVDAGMAFGSGEHATTEGCLRLFDDYLNVNHRRAQQNDFTVLDMGCGSAILAMAAAKRLRKASVIGVDIDEVSVQVAKENAKLNGVQHQLKLFLGNGYKSKAVYDAAPFDLVFANILARPLMSMAEDLSRALAADGTAILSGLLTKQETMVLGAHKLVGLHLQKRWRKDGWSALLLRKS